MLQEIDAQHSFNTDRSATGSRRIGVERLNSFTKFFPGNDRFHIVQELFLASHLAEFLKTVSERCLLHEIFNHDQCDVSIIAEIAN